MQVVMMMIKLLLTILLLLSRIVLNAPVVSVASRLCQAKIETTIQVSGKTNCEHILEYCCFCRNHRNHPTPWIVILHLGSSLFTKCLLKMCSEFEPIRAIPRLVFGIFVRSSFAGLYMRWGKGSICEVLVPSLPIHPCNIWGSRGNYFPSESLLSVLVADSQFICCASCEVSATLGFEVVSVEMEHLLLRLS